MKNNDYDILEHEFSKFVEHVMDYCEEMTYQELSIFLLKQAEYYDGEDEC